MMRWIVLYSIYLEWFVFLVFVFFYLYGKFGFGFFVVVGVIMEEVVVIFDF